MNVKAVPHRYVVLSIPKILRWYFPYDRKLLSDLCRCGWAAFYKGGIDEQRNLRDLLRSKMENNGLEGLKFEWRHFDFKDWKFYRIENIPFEDIK